MKKIKELIKKIDYKDVIIFLIPFILFGVYLIILYPGVLSYDSYNQIWQFKTMTFNSAHPFFHTFIEMVLMSIMNTPAIIGIFQILCFSILWSRICKYNRNKHSKFSFYYQIILTIIICLNPLNKVLSITLWKDVLYSYTILWFCFEMEKLIDNKFKISFKEVIKLSFLLILLPNLRHNGYLVTIIMSIILFIIFIIKDKKSLNYLKLFGFLIIFFLGFKGLERIYNVGAGTLGISTTDNIVDSKVMAVVGEIGRYGNYSKDDKEKIEKYVNFDCLAKMTNFNSWEPMGAYCKMDLSLVSKERVKVYKTIFNMMKKNIILTMNFYLKEYGYVWRIVRYKDSWGIINYYGINSRNAGSLQYQRPFENTKLYIVLINYIVFTRTNVIFQTMFYSGALCMYLSIILLIYLKKKKKKGMFLVFLPTLINVIGVALTASVNDVRYYYSNFLVLYLLGAIFLKYWVIDNE